MENSLDVIHISIEEILKTPTLVLEWTEPIIAIVSLFPDLAGHVYSQGTDIAVWIENLKKLEMPHYIDRDAMLYYMGTGLTPPAGIDTTITVRINDEKDLAFDISGRLVSYFNDLEVSYLETNSYLWHLPYE